MPDILMQPVRCGGWGSSSTPRRCRGSWSTRPMPRRSATAARDAQFPQALPRGRVVADPQPRPARAHHSQGGLRDRGASGGFFRQGVTGLRPLSLAMVAEAVELHESTVSRVTASKYMATPAGCWSSSSSSPMRWAGRRGLLRIGARPHRAPDRGGTPDGVLSDDRIVALLRAEGIDIARRTVAKYRKALGLGVLRRAAAPRRRRPV